MGRKSGKGETIRSNVDLGRMIAQVAQAGGADRGSEGQRSLAPQSQVGRAIPPALIARLTFRTPACSSGDVAFGVGMDGRAYFGQ